MQRLRTCRGQSLVEFALVLPLMVTVMLGIVDFGFVFFVRGSVENAAREGARYGSIHPSDVSGITNRVKQTVMGIDTSSSAFKDDGSLYLHRRTMQNAADAGAFAGARLLSLSIRDTPTIRSEIETYAGKNYVINPASDVTAYYTDDSGAQVGAITSAAGTAPATA